METANGKKRSPEFAEESKNSQLETRNRSLGTVSVGSSGYGTNEIPASRKDSDESDILVGGQWGSSGIPGKIISQLIEENERQMEYHEQQAELIRSRIKQLRDIPKNLVGIARTE